jgi:hypothetical protein
MSFIFCSPLIVKDNHITINKFTGTTWLNRVLLVILFSHSGSTDMLMKGREVKLYLEELILITIREIIHMSLSLGRATGR